MVFCEIVQNVNNIIVNYPEIYLSIYLSISAGWGLDDMKAEIHSFPTMYIIGGGKWGRNGSKLRFSEKKWSKNSFFVLHKFGSTDFEGVSDPYF